MIHSRFFCLYIGIVETTVDVNLPPERNLKDIVENLFFTHDPIPDKIMFLILNLILFRPRQSKHSK